MKKKMTELEKLVDRNGLSCILEAISDICSTKASHALYDIHDPILCTEWEKATSIVRKAYNASRKLKLR
jgi:hypothetical protein